MSAVDQLIVLAKGEVGYLEKKTNSNLYDKTANAGSNNYNKYAYELASTDIFNGNKNGYAWCTSFYCWLWYHLWGAEKTKKALYLPSKSLAADCDFAVQYYKAEGKFGSTPQLGAQIFFKSSDGSYYAHTGAVVGFDANYVYTIEGNTSGASGVISNGGGVCAKQYPRSGSTRIGGYGYPDWSVVEGTATTTTTATSTTATATTKIFDTAKTYKNGASSTPVYSESILKTKTGSLNAYEECECLAIVNGKYLVKYKVDGTSAYKTGFVAYSGGVS